MELILVRHALPERVSRLDGTPADPGLAELGRRQAHALAGWLGHPHEGPIHALYSSPMRRARETAEPVAKTLGLEPCIDDDLAEWDRDASEYVPLEELRAAKDERWLALVSDSWQRSAERLAFQTAVVGAMERIIAAHRAQRVVVVCHGGVINAYLSHVIGLPETRNFFHPEYTNLIRVMAASSGQRNVHSMNEVPHLRGGLLPRR